FHHQPRSTEVKLYGNPMSTCTRKVLMTLAETNTPCELDVVDIGNGAHKKEPHLSRQPFGQIPTLDDDGFQFFESRAICRYINDKVGGSLVPKDLKGRALMEEWISIETSNFTPHAMKFVYEFAFHRKQADGVLEAAGKSLDTAFAYMEKTLSKSDFLAGPELTIADICFMPYIEYTMGSPVKEMMANYPHVIAWWNRISERPTWQKVAGRAS
ncbi:MAG: glutathione binding-like protein, partial [Polyangiaceae bacterium]